MKIIKSIVLFGIFSSLISCSKGYYIKNGKVYFESSNEFSGKTQRLIKEADAKTFQKLKYGYAKDKKYIFKEGEMLKNSDAKTFKILSKIYAIDKNQAYYYGHRFEISEFSKFKIIDDIYSTDGKAIFYKSSRLDVCNCKEWKVIQQDKYKSYSWSTDGCFYYCNKDKVPSNNYNEIIFFPNSPYAKDNTYVYAYGMKLGYNEKGEKVFDVNVAYFTVDKNGNTNLQK